MQRLMESLWGLLLEVMMRDWKLSSFWRSSFIKQWVLWPWLELIGVLLAQKDSWNWFDIKLSFLFFYCLFLACCLWALYSLDDEETAKDWDPKRVGFVQSEHSFWRHHKWVNHQMSREIECFPLRGFWNEEEAERDTILEDLSKRLVTDLNSLPFFVLFSFFTLINFSLSTSHNLSPSSSTPFYFNS